MRHECSVSLESFTPADDCCTLEWVWARHEDGRRSRSEESDDESDTEEKEERETKDKVEGCVQEGHADCRTERGR